MNNLLCTLHRELMLSDITCSCLLFIYVPVPSCSTELYPGVGFICLMFILRTCVIMSSRKIIQSELQLSNVHFMKAYYLVHQRDSQVCVSAVWSMIISCNYTIMCNRKTVQYLYPSVVRVTYLYFRVQQGDCPVQRRGLQLHVELSYVQVMYMFYHIQQEDSPVWAPDLWCSSYTAV